MNGTSGKQPNRRIRLISRISAVLIAVALLPTVPVVYTMVLNEFRLWKFARQLIVFDEVAKDTNSTLIAEGRQISVASNANDCWFGATRLYVTFGSFDVEQTSNWKLVAENHVFAQARKPDDGSNADTYLDVAKDLLIVRIESGGFPAGLDFRCW